MTAGEVFLNGRHPAGWELPALQRARECERERDLRVLAGVLSGDPVPVREARPVTDIGVEFGFARRPA